MALSTYPTYTNVSVDPLPQCLLKVPKLLKPVWTREFLDPWASVMGCAQVCPHLNSQVYLVPIYALSKGGVASLPLAPDSLACFCDQSGTDEVVEQLQPVDVSKYCTQLCGGGGGYCGGPSGVGPDGTGFKYALAVYNVTTLDNVQPPTSTSSQSTSPLVISLAVFVAILFVLGWAHVYLQLKRRRQPTKSFSTMKGSPLGFSSTKSTESQGTLFSQTTGTFDGSVRDQEEHSKPLFARQHQNRKSKIATISLTPERRLFHATLMRLQQQHNYELTYMNHYDPELKYSSMIVVEPSSNSRAPSVQLDFGDDPDG
ncbi:hypothetical protein BC830DRAFT_752961 [Chytriomyces sp. MP71]|nr:hypothetical protein BC830DRAFT_752961 [Chytriomyces sp. MP71]